MIDWANLVASGDWVSILLFLIMGLITGGVVNSLIESHRAKKRGIAGDAIQKEQNNTSEFDTLTGAQKGFITELRDELNNVKNELKEYKKETTARIDALQEELEEEREYSNGLIGILIEHQAPIPARASKDKPTT